MPLLARPAGVREKNIILRRLAEYALLALFLIASTRAITVPLKPLIDFRF
jgi:hypothetical protein